MEHNAGSVVIDVRRVGGVFLGATEHRPSPQGVYEFLFRSARQAGGRFSAGSASPGGLPKPSDVASTSPPANGSVVDEFGLDSTPTVDTTTDVDDDDQDDPGRQAARSGRSRRFITRCRWWRFWPGSAWGPTDCRSSCYGPPEAFEMLMPRAGDFRFLAVFLALATARHGVRDFGLL